MYKAFGSIARNPMSGIIIIIERHENCPFEFKHKVKVLFPKLGFDESSV